MCGEGGGGYMGECMVRYVGGGYGDVGGGGMVIYIYIWGGVW